MKDFRQCVQVFFNLNVAGQNNLNTIPWNLTFDPDEVIVKQVTYTAANPEAPTYFIRTNLTEQPVIASFHGAGYAIGGTPVGMSVQLNNHFTLRSYSNRSYNFQVMETSGVNSYVLSQGTGELSLILEFVKHAEK